MVADDIWAALKPLKVFVRGVTVNLTLMWLNLIVCWLLYLHQQMIPGCIITKTLTYGCVKNIKKAHFLPLFPFLSYLRWTQLWYCFSSCLRLETTELRGDKIIKSHQTWSRPSLRTAASFKAPLTSRDAESPQVSAGQSGDQTGAHFKEVHGVGPLARGEQRGATGQGSWERGAELMQVQRWARRVDAQSGSVETGRGARPLRSRWSRFKANCLNDVICGYRYESITVLLDRRNWN